jgi:hypothetical protein
MSVNDLSKLHTLLCKFRLEAASEHHAAMCAEECDVVTNTVCRQLMEQTADAGTV